MVNMGIIWGFVLGVLLLIAINLYIKKRVQKEVIRINVKRPEEINKEGNRGTNAEGISNERRVGVEGESNQPKPIDEGRIEGEGFYRADVEQVGVQSSSDKTNDGDEPDDAEHSETVEPVSITIPDIEPFEE